MNGPRDGVPDRTAATRVLGGVTGGAAVGAAAMTAHLLVNRQRLRVPPRGTHPPGLVSVLIPARDEAHRIGPTIRALRASTDVELEVVVCDDASTDGTAEVVTAAAGGDPRVRVVRSDGPPEGWLGKPAACARLAAEARGDVLVFCDADVVVAPDGIARAAAAVGPSGLDLASPYPRQLALSAGERLVQPLLQWSWLAFLPLRRAERSPRPSLTAANGQLLAIRRRTYDIVGGHEAVRRSVLDDVDLARAVKAHGFSAGVVDGTDLAVCRMYASWPEVRDGYSKSLWAAFGSPAGACGAVGLLAWLCCWPLLAVGVGLARRDRRMVSLGLAGYAAGVIGRGAAAQRTGGRVGDAWQHPASIGALGWLTWRSWRGVRRGDLTWRGRAVRQP